MTTPSSPKPRRRPAVLVPAGRLTLDMAAARLNLSLSSFRRAIRPKDEGKTKGIATLWARRLEMTSRARPGNLIDGFFVSELLLNRWAHVICPAGRLVAPPKPIENGSVAGADEDEPLE